MREQEDDVQLTPGQSCQLKVSRAHQTIVVTGIVFVTKSYFFRLDKEGKSRQAYVYRLPSLVNGDTSPSSLIINQVC